MNTNDLINLFHIMRGAAPRESLFLRPATARGVPNANGEVQVLVDGDSAVSYVSVLSDVIVQQNDRVMVLFYPPAGGLVIGGAGARRTALLPVSFQASGGFALTLTTSFVAMTGLAISVPVLAGDIIEANLVTDLRIFTGVNAQTNALPEAKLAVDGVTQSQSAFIWLDRVEANSTAAFIVSQNYRIVAPASATRTLTVHAKYGGTALVAGASAVMDGAHTNLAVKVYRPYS